MESYRLSFLPRQWLMALLLGLGFLSAVALIAMAEDRGGQDMGWSGPGFTRIAVVPFFVAGKPPNPDAEIDKTLALTLDVFREIDPDIESGADELLTRYTQGYLKGRFPERVVPLDEMREVLDRIMADSTVDTLRSLGRKAGERLGADTMVFGTIWRFRKRDAMDETSASVAFAVYLMDVRTGKRFCRGFFDAAQKPMTENVMEIRKQMKTGATWKTADEMVRAGVRQVFKKCIPPGSGDAAGNAEISDR